MTLASDDKWQHFIVLSVKETGGNSTDPDPENSVGFEDNGSPGRPVCSGLQAPGETENCRGRTRFPW